MRTKKHYDQADAYMKEKQYDQAIAECGKVLDIDASQEAASRYIASAVKEKMGTTYVEAKQAYERGDYPAGLRALNHRDFRLFIGGQLISLIGTWMQSVAQSWLVLVLTDSPFKLGLIGTLQFGPMLSFSFVAGAIADRLPKRRFIIGTQTALMLQAFALALLAWLGDVQYWHGAVLAACYGLANTLDMPARQSFIVEMTSKDDLTNAIALNSAMFNGARMVGPAVAGLLVDRFGVALAFGLNGLSFVAVILALCAMRTECLPREREGTTVRDGHCSRPPLRGRHAP